MTKRSTTKTESAQKKPSPFLRERAAAFADIFAERPPFQELRDALKSDTPADFTHGAPARFIPGAIETATTELRSYLVSSADRAIDCLRKFNKAKISEQAAAREKAAAAVAVYREAVDCWRKSEEAILWLRDLMK
jgi:hypothetical protein